MPEDIRRHRPSDAIVRSIVAQGFNLVQGRGEGAASIARRAWPNDPRTLEFLTTRAASAPASTTATGWAAELALPAVADLITGLGPASAGSGLIRRAISLELGNSASIFVPTLTASAGDVGFIAEGAPIPIRQLLIGGPILTAKKFAVGFALNREVFEHSTPSAERLVRAAVDEAMALRLDTALFDALPGDDIRPGGMLNGVAAIAATAGGSSEAMIADLAALTSAVSAVGGADIAFVCSPARALKIALRSNTPLPMPVLASGAIADDVVIAVALRALAIAVDPEADVSVAAEAVIHSEDTSPLAIATAGTPNTVAAPATSLWQVDAFGVRLILRVTWALRAVGAVAFIAGTTW